MLCFKDGERKQKSCYLFLNRYQHYQLLLKEEGYEIYSTLDVYVFLIHCKCSG
uniref:Uncharacterized protein n=1 Tax=Arundo donax TaxID=35708 RepID=A0A0A9FW00_ARUDO